MDEDTNIILTNHFYNLVIEHAEDTKKKKNLQKLTEISELKKGWNHNGAPSFSKTLTLKVSDIIVKLPIQPDVFPTANGSIQIEYEKENEDYLEFEIYEDRVECFRVINDIEFEEIIQSNFSNTINRLVRDFYE